MSEIEHILDRVAVELSWLVPPPVFLGGATISLFLDAFGRAQMRPTKDIDCIVPEILSSASWWALEEQLRERGWSPLPDGPICRYRSPSGALVDLMSEEPEVLGFSGRWYPQAVKGAQQRALVTGRQVAVPRPEHLLACKLEAWTDRGRDDPLVSQDLEDVVALLDGCRELESCIVHADEDLRVWIGAMLMTIQNTREQREAAIAHLPIGGDQGERERRFLMLMDRLTQLQVS